MCFLFCSVCKAINEEVCLLLFALSLQTAGKIAFSVKLCVSTHEGKGRGMALSWMSAARRQDGVRLE